MKRVSVMVFGLCAAGALVACSSSNNGGGAPADMAHGTGGNGGGGGSAGGGGGGSSGGGGGTTTPADLAMAPVGTLPFVVDDQFAPSGYMGDGATTGVVTMLPSAPTDSRDCNGNRSSANALGICHTITYVPPATNPTWAGVYWQYPANNWGSKPGYSIPPGATKVSFWAKGAVGGEKVAFLAGGIVSAGMSYTDSLKASTNAVLTNAWAQYSIDLTGQTYTQVLGAFGWTMAATDAGASAQFFVDDIEWQ